MRIICCRCRKTPEETGDFCAYDMDQPVDFDEAVKDDGTYNARLGLFCCNRCYIAIGMPSGPNGWKPQKLYPVPAKGN